MNTRNKLLQVTLAALISVIGFSDHVDAKSTNLPASSSMLETRATKAPIGYVNFCVSYADYCQDTQSRPQVAELSDANWQLLTVINNSVNEMVEEVTDEELHGIAELWSFPGRYGDCEDYVLEKRRLLMSAGWPASSLSITVVRDENGFGHAVLTVITEEGDFILDNRSDEISPWFDTGYSYIKRQSIFNSQDWVRLANLG